METHDLISQLSSDLKPVKPLAPPFTRFLQWLTVTAMVLIAYTAWKVWRMPNFGDALGSPIRFLETMSLLAVGLFSASGAFALSVPGEEERRATRWWPVVALGVWLGFLAIRFGSTPFSVQGLTHAFGTGHGCAIFSFSASLVPGILLFYMLRKAAPLRSGWTGSLALIAMGAMGAFTIQFLCPGAGAMHFLVWHYTPVVGLGLVGIFAGKALLRWRPRA